MRHPHIDFARRDSGHAANFHETFRQRAHGKLEDLAAIHLNKGRARNFAVFNARVACKRINAEGAVRMHAVRKNTFTLAGFDHNSARAVAKKHACRSVIPVKQSAQHFSAHDEGPFVTPGANQTVGNAHGINKASANRLHVKCCAPLDAQGILQSAGHRRKQAVGSGCRHDDEVNCLRIDIAARQSVAGRIHSQRKRRLPIHGDVTAADAGARANPFVARLNAALGKLFSEITVGHSTIS